MTCHAHGFFRFGLTLLQLNKKNLKLKKNKNKNKNKPKQRRVVIKPPLCTYRLLNSPKGGSDTLNHLGVVALLNHLQASNGQAEPEMHNANKSGVVTRRVLDAWTLPIDPHKAFLAAGKCLSENDFFFFKFGLLLF